MKNLGDRTDSQKIDADESVPEVSLNELSRMGSRALMTPESSISEPPFLNQQSRRRSSLNEQDLESNQKDDVLTAMYIKRHSSMDAVMDTKLLPPLIKDDVAKGDSHQTITGKPGLIHHDVDANLGLIELAHPEKSAEGTPAALDHSQGHILHQQHIVHTPVLPDSISDEPIEYTPLVSFSPVACHCASEHEAMKPVLDHIFNASIDHLWDILFGSTLDPGTFCKDFWETQLKYKEAKVSRWAGADSEIQEADLVNDGPLTLEDVKQGFHRKLQYLVPVTNPLGMHFDV